jgi:hypothetical protein
MWYVPDKEHHKRLKLLQWPLPSKLLPWLRKKRGMGLVVLPRGPGSALRFIRERLAINERVIGGDGRLLHLTSHYDNVRKLIVMSNDSFWSNEGENVFLHEVGHAVDFLYREDRVLLSFLPKIIKILEPDKPLNDYCKRKYNDNNNLIEQFATAFAAYFNEVKGPETPTVDDLNPALVNLFNNLFNKFEH